uniref:BAF250_C domain-containing protein n=1 Tax=Rhabditophanes sp. KR3021 TaxID=114890 RepID=A0AC35TJ48_9BILA
MRSDAVAVNYMKGLGVGFGEGISCQIKNIVTLDEEIEGMKETKHRKSENDVVNKDIKSMQTEVDRKKNCGLYPFRHLSAQQLADRCLALSNIIPKNEDAIRKSYSQLNILGKYLKLKCGEKKVNYCTSETREESKEEDDLMGDMVLEDDDSILDHVADTLRQAAFGILSFICGYLNLIESNQCEQGFLNK